jgi:hypothetical protein
VKLADKIVNKIEYGDFQTPTFFTRRVCAKIRDFYGLSPSIIFEPTFGIGNFFSGIISTFPKPYRLIGVESNFSYYNIVQDTFAKLLTHDIQYNLYNEDIFSFNFKAIKSTISTDESLLIIGNPPWVTNSRLSSLESANIPLKSNIKGFVGLDAITGKSNFDIAECIILRLLLEFSQYNCVLAMLCKASVAKNIIRDIDKFNFSLDSVDFFSFNASEIFGVSCDAGLFVARLGADGVKICVARDFDTNKKLRDFGWLGEAFYANIDIHHGKSAFDGKCQLEWRQGVKHDCAKIMEFSSSDGMFFLNALGEERRFTLGRYIFPLVKSSDIKSYKITKNAKIRAHHSKTRQGGDCGYKRRGSRYLGIFTEP